MKNKFHLWLMKKVYNLGNKIYLAELQHTFDDLTVTDTDIILEASKTVRFNIFAGTLRVSFSAPTPKNDVEMGKTLVEIGTAMQAPRRTLTKEELDVL